MVQTVLLAGGTGMLGSRIAHHLVTAPDTRLRLLVRRGTETTGRSPLMSLVDHGAEILEGDLRDSDALHRATQGVDVIVSAVQGGPDVIVDGQAALAQAGKRNGVRRICRRTSRSTCSRQPRASTPRLTRAAQLTSASPRSAWNR